jgi:hypothetical protein
MKRNYIINDKEDIREKLRKGNDYKSKDFSNG